MIIRNIVTVVLAVALTATVASAAPVHWTVQPAFFNDGGRLVGSFIYDADTHIYSSIGLTTFGGTYPGEFYSVWDPTQDRDPGRTLTAWVSTEGGLLGQRELYLPFIGTLTNAGGSVTIANYIEGPCAEIGPLTGNICLPLQVRTGFFATMTGTPLPLPQGVWLLGGALGVLAWIRKVRT